MLGFDVSERTISRWMKRAPRDPDRAKRWLAFLRNQIARISAWGRKRRTAELRDSIVPPYLRNTKKRHNSLIEEFCVSGIAGGSSRVPPKRRDWHQDDMGDEIGLIARISNREIQVGF